MSLIRVFAAFPIFLVLTAPEQPWPPPEAQQVPQEFTAGVNRYSEIRRLVTAPLRLLDMCSEPEDLLRQQGAFARAIREGRSNAREGDIFTLDTVRYFRALIAEAASQQGRDLTVEVEDASEWDIEAVVLEVNTPLPWNAGPMMWPSVLWRLPVLPPELEYRFVGRNLVLVDVVGNVIVDVLRESLPTSASSYSG